MSDRDHKYNQEVILLIAVRPARAGELLRESRSELEVMMFKGRCHAFNFLPHNSEARGFLPPAGNGLPNLADHLSGLGHA